MGNSYMQIDYHLSLQEATQFISMSIEYAIAEIVDPEVEVVAKIKKKIPNGVEESMIKISDWQTKTAQNIHICNSKGQ